MDNTGLILSRRDLDFLLYEWLDGQVTTGPFAAGDVNVALANSSVYLEAVGHAVVAWMWLLAGESKAGDFYDGKRAAVRYFFRWELPKVDVQLGLLASPDTTALDMQNAWFSCALYAT